MPRRKSIRTDIAWSAVDRITVKGGMAYPMKMWAEDEATAHLRGA